MYDLSHFDQLYVDHRRMLNVMHEYPRRTIKKWFLLFFESHFLNLQLYSRRFFWFLQVLIVVVR